jgi:hypothetical protein
MNRELIPPQVSSLPQKFGVKLVSKTADWSGFVSFSVL